MSVQVNKYINYKPNTNTMTKYLVRINRIQQNISLNANILYGLLLYTYGSVPFAEAGRRRQRANKYHQAQQDTTINNNFLFHVITNIQHRHTHKHARRHTLTTTVQRTAEKRIMQNGGVPPSRGRRCKMSMEVPSPPPPLSTCVCHINSFSTLH